jgi:hypothetical protein
MTNLLASPSIRLPNVLHQSMVHVVTDNTSANASAWPLSEHLLRREADGSFTIDGFAVLEEAVKALDVSATRALPTCSCHVLHSSSLCESTCLKMLAWKIERRTQNSAAMGIPVPTCPLLDSVFS